MSKVKYFEIENFKGIDKIRIDVEKSGVNKRFISLVGLNECGKTTILEALSHSVLADDTTNAFIGEVQGQPENNELIPKYKRAAFTGTTTVSCVVELSVKDKLRIQQFIKSSFDYDLISEIPNLLRIYKTYAFEDSDHKKTTNYWTLSLNVKKPRAKKSITFDSATCRDEWIKTVHFIRDLLPSIVYFPTFLIDFPRRIYLEGIHGNTDKYYRNVINDVLGSLSPSLSLQRHIIDRIDKHRAVNDGGSLGSALRLSSDSQNIDATVQEISNELNRVIFGAWNDIFGKKIEGRRINVELHIDEDTKEVFLEIYIVSGKSKYYISERSLGFRWFFSFLLFTQFHSKNKGNSSKIFLFDEPASHLHAKAQTRLLESFEKIAEPNHTIIYSTHSHYLIKPLWLEQSYIVSNKAIDLDEDDPSSEFSDVRTVIQIEMYKNFVNSHPTKMTYFQPILDAIDYTVSPHMIAKRTVILEGKYDFYPFKYLQSKSNFLVEMQVVPALGAGSMASIISLLRGWGYKFVIVLDDDAAGRREKGRYLVNYLLSTDQVVTLADLDSRLTGMDFESIYRDDFSQILRAEGILCSDPLIKKDYYNLFQSLIANPMKKYEMPNTQAMFDCLLAAIDIRFNNQ